MRSLLVVVLLGTFRPLVKAKCPQIPCETGKSCDYKTGTCQKFQIPDGFQLFAADWNKCEYVKCPPLYSCDGTSGVCTRDRPTHVQLAVDLCDGVDCPPEYPDCVEGKCIRKFNGFDFDGICRNVQCPFGFECTPPDGRTAHDDCIPTCVCVDGYVQVSALNTTCVPSHECMRISADDQANCQNLKCGGEMQCVGGHCNPNETASEILKPPLTAACQKIVVVRDRRNCIALLNECDLQS
ncbi:hypothetical protein M3Y99_00615200 [Aphelenchoides fujianensis]|nr:hypothetical protein M3Y99_00615200 [Aphelenchoides fujianensis]